MRSLDIFDAPLAVVAELDPQTDAELEDDACAIALDFVGGAGLWEGPDGVRYDAEVLARRIVHCYPLWKAIAGHPHAEVTV